MRVLFLAAEAAPWVKVGGLGDVAGELPPALQARGADVRVALPLHAALDASGLRLARAAEVVVPRQGGGQPAHIVEARGGEVPLWLIDGAPLHGAAAVYGPPADDAEKFVFSFLAALRACRALGWAPDIVHAHDWHAAPALAWLRAIRAEDAFWSRTAGVLTIHNLPFMGAGGEAALAAYGLAPSHDERLPAWARARPLPLGLASADWLTAVSPGYAREIQTAAFGCGLESFLQARADRLEGILNGIARERWDPACDVHLPARYDRTDASPRAANKRALQQTFGLAADPQTPLLAMVSRLDRQKGVDLALAALERLADVPWQFLLLGTGDADLARAAQDFAVAHAARARAVLRFEAALASRIYGGADLMLVPSRYEPCGLTQMIAMRYGCLPVVRATGGLRDSVIDAEQPEGTGFVFEPADPEALAQALRRALAAYAVLPRWRALQARAMRTSFDWAEAAKRYLDVFDRAQRSVVA